MCKIAPKKSNALCFGAQRKICNEKMLGLASAQLDGKFIERWVTRVPIFFL
jgi:hypothetical protein